MYTPIEYDLEKVDYQKRTRIPTPSIWIQGLLNRMNICKYLTPSNYFIKAYMIACNVQLHILDNGV
jgi:hypothetical protein